MTIAEAAARGGKQGKRRLWMRIGRILEKDLWWSFLWWIV